MQLTYVRPWAHVKFEGRFCALGGLPCNPCNNIANKLRATAQALNIHSLHCSCLALTSNDVDDGESISCDSSRIRRCNIKKSWVYSSAAKMGGEHVPKIKLHGRIKNARLVIRERHHFARWHHRRSTHKLHYTHCINHSVRTKNRFLHCGINCDLQCTLK